MTEGSYQEFVKTQMTRGRETQPFQQAQRTTHRRMAGHRTRCIGCILARYWGMQAGGVMRNAGAKGQLRKAAEGRGQPTVNWGVCYHPRGYALVLSRSLRLWIIQRQNYFIARLGKLHFIIVRTIYIIQRSIHPSSHGHHISERRIWFSSPRVDERSEK